MRALPNYDNSLRSGEIGAEGPIFSLLGGDARLAIGAGYRANRLRVDSRRIVGGVEAPIDVFREWREVLSSEERRVGKACVSKCRSWWSTYHSNTTRKQHKT